MSNSVIAADSFRHAELAKIHIGAKALGLDRDTYEKMLWAIARVRSAADLGAEGRAQVLAHLKARGFKPHKSMRKAHHDTTWDWVNNAAPDRQAMLRKLAVMLKAADREKAYVDAISKHMFGIERVEFCAPDQLRRIVSALVYDQRRRAG